MRDGLQVVCLRVAPEKQFGRHDRVQNVSTELRVDWTREKRISTAFSSGSAGLREAPYPEPEPQRFPSWCSTPPGVLGRCRPF